MNYYQILLIASGLLLLTLALNKVASRFGISSLLVALSVGLFFGNGGEYGFVYEFPDMTLHISEIALAFIIFSGGFHANWEKYKLILKEGIIISTLGVLITTGIVALFCNFILRLDLLFSLLIGSVISSTDAAAVFSILENSNLKFKQNTAEVLEFESGTNDPMAYFLTFSFSMLMINSNMNGFSIIPQFFINMSVGFLIGAVMGFIFVYLNRKIILKRGQNTVFFIASVIFIYALNNIFEGSSLLSVFVAGLIIGNSGIRSKEYSMNFFEGMSWLMETVLFILLGLEVFLDKLPDVFLTGIWITLVLIFIARPAGVFISYLFIKKTSIRKKTLISWVGLRGATPLVFALIPAVYHVPDADQILHITFVVVTLSIILQGFGIRRIAIKLKMAE